MTSADAVFTALTYPVADNW